ncbi:hypothetical protein FXO38_00703 [Capsicum annuum]|nr:hypothetical protein FXO37_33968 [Capsicum annuum]KAF3683613.1 hypothetical protein FXO38_00703 [Capsicum annuum]
MLIPNDTYSWEYGIYPTYVSHLLERSMRDNGWVQQFNHEVCNVYWFKCPFTRYYPCISNCSCIEYDEAWSNKDDVSGFEAYQTYRVPIASLHDAIFSELDSIVLDGDLEIQAEVLLDKDWDSLKNDLFNCDYDPVLLTKADKIAGIITTNHVDLDSKADRSPHLSKRQERHKRYTKYRRAKKLKPPNKESTRRKPMKRNLGKNKCFICHDKGHFGKIPPCLHRGQDFNTFMTMKNLAERGKSIILSEYTSKFYGIFKYWWNSLGTEDKNTYLTSQDFTLNIRIWKELLCRDTGYITQAIF